MTEKFNYAVKLYPDDSTRHTYNNRRCTVRVYTDSAGRLHHLTKPARKTSSGGVCICEEWFIEGRPCRAGMNMEELMADPNFDLDALLPVYVFYKKGVPVKKTYALNGKIIRRVYYKNGEPYRQILSTMDGVGRIDTRKNSWQKITRRVNLEGVVATDYETSFHGALVKISTILAALAPSSQEEIRAANRLLHLVRDIALEIIGETQ
jgi:hypothetical protein